MKTRVKRPMTAEKVLMIIAALCAALLLIVTAMSAPYFRQDEDPEAVIHETPTQMPTETVPSEPTEPIIPSPEANPYGRLDFQYSGRYLKSLRCESIPGVDVSSYQGDVNWRRVAASGIRFAMIRAGFRGYGTGKLVEDTCARQNLKGAAEAGLKVGVYFFSQALNAEEVHEEIDFLLDIIGDTEITMPVVFDWEYISDTARTADMDARTLTDLNLEFCERMEKEGYRPMIYFNSSQARKLMYLYELEDYPFWLAYYTDRMTYPYRFEMWQYTNKGRVPGIEGEVDVNVMLLDQKLRPE